MNNMYKLKTHKVTYKLQLHTKIDYLWNCTTKINDNQNINFSISPCSDIFYAKFSKVERWKLVIESWLILSMVNFNIVHQKKKIKPRQSTFFDTFNKHIFIIFITRRLQKQLETLMLYYFFNIFRKNEDNFWHLLFFFFEKRFIIFRTILLCRIRKLQLIRKHRN